MGEVSGTTVHLVRHAAHDRVDRILCGRMAGVSLGEHGRAEAAAVAHELAREQIVAVLASPLERAQETARPIADALGLLVQIAEGLNEIDCGEWTGQPFAELEADPRWQGWNRERENGRAPGGEAMRDVQARVLRALEEWRVAYPGRAVVAVSHADVIKAAVCGVLGLSLDRYASFDVAPASIATVVLWEGGGKLLALNQVPHLLLLRRPAQPALEARTFASAGALLRGDPGSARIAPQDEVESEGKVAPRAAA